MAPVTLVIAMLSDSASPAALFTIGAVLPRAQGAAAGSGSPQERRRELSRLVIFKLLLHPLEMLALGSIMIFAGAPLSQFSLLVLMFVAALPNASNVPIAGKTLRCRQRAHCPAWCCSALPCLLSASLLQLRSCSDWMSPKRMVHSTSVD